MIEVRPELVNGRLAPVSSKAVKSRFQLSKILSFNPVQYGVAGALGKNEIEGNSGTHPALSASALARRIQTSGAGGV